MTPVQEIASHLKRIADALEEQNRLAKLITGSPTDPEGDEDALYYATKLLNSCHDEDDEE
jgi:hypothetical protein